MKIEAGWLLELKHTNMQGEMKFDWWVAPNWTPDASQALRFARKSDGERVLKYLEERGPVCSPDGHITVTEHLFLVDNDKLSRSSAWTDGYPRRLT